MSYSVQLLITVWTLLAFTMTSFLVNNVEQTEQYIKIPSSSYYE